MEDERVPNDLESSRNTRLLIGVEDVFTPDDTFAEGANLKTGQM